MYRATLSRSAAPLNAGGEVGHAPVPSGLRSSSQASSAPSRIDCWSHANGERMLDSKKNGNTGRFWGPVNACGNMGDTGGAVRPLKISGPESTGCPSLFHTYAGSPRLGVLKSDMFVRIMLIGSG